MLVIIQSSRVNDVHENTLSNYCEKLRKTTKSVSILLVSICWENKIKKFFLFIIVLWSFSSYAGGLSSLGNMIKRCSMGFLGSRSRVVEVKETQKDEEVFFPYFVLLVRHASYRGTPDVGGETAAREQAKAYDLSDVRLRLSKEGKEKFMEMCKARSFCSFDLLIHSPSMRTWETANIFSEHFTVQKRRISDNLSEYHSEPEDILQEIRDSNANTIVLVGHQPSLIKFLSEALGKDDSTAMARILLDGYGSMIPLKFSSWEFGAAELHF